MPYKVHCWIRIDEEDPTIHETEEEAEKEMKEMQHMQPENIYQVEECF